MPGRRSQCLVGTHDPCRPRACSVCLTRRVCTHWEPFVMSSHVKSCHVMSCHVMSCHVMSCHVMSCQVKSSQVKPSQVKHSMATAGHKAETCSSTSPSKRTQKGQGGKIKNGRQVHVPVEESTRSDEHDKDVGGEDANKLHIVQFMMGAPQSRKVVHESEVPRF